MNLHQSPAYRQEGPGNGHSPSLFALRTGYIAGCLGEVRRESGGGYDMINVCMNETAKE